ncbi:MAG: carbohydrate ABC transporter substrate-binding protein [SAR324 cluster bacterium]|nr:carbohydrate ABC transporter substrate-binding protein [SAR324 cluster bacterium]
MRIFIFHLLTPILGLSLLLGGAKNLIAAGEVEVLHWWTSGGEATALRVIKDNLQKKGVSWVDMPIAGGAGVNAMTVLRARVSSGKPPTAVQLLGFDITSWAEEDVLADLNDLAKQENWNKVIPQPLQDFAIYKGKWVSVPINVHSTNWVWANKAIFDKLNLAVPTNWNEFKLAVEKIKKAGIIPIAHGGQPWQDATIFDSLVMVAGGADFYKKAFLDLDAKALGSKTMEKAFSYLRFIRANLDPNFSGRDWNLASSMVIEGKAAMQIMGDWAKGEFVKADQVAGKDFICFRFPGTQGNVTFNADQFAMFKLGKSQKVNQDKLALVIADKDTQARFNQIKGSVPARIDISDAGFDACGKKGIKDLRESAANGTMMGSMAHGYAAPPAVKNAVFDVVTKFFNDEKVTPAKAAKMLAVAVAIAQ